MQVLSFVTLSIGPLAVLIIIAVAAARGRARTLGIIGGVLLLLATVAGNLLSSFFPLIMKESGLSASTMSLFFIPSNIVSVVAMVLLSIAVVVGSRDRLQTPQPGPGPQPGPQGYR